MKVITLRNIPPELARVILRRARERRTSVTRAAISLLQDATGTGERRPGALYHELDALAGSWTKVEAEAFEAALREQRVIDPNMWT